jgi:transcriptional regulator with XRE-family HTH domain
MAKRAKLRELDLHAIGRRIRELRGFYVSQAAFAGRIGVTQSYLSALERGQKEPGAAVLLSISREIGKSVDWILTGKATKDN